MSLFREQADTIAATSPKEKYVKFSRVGQHFVNSTAKKAEHENGIISAYPPLPFLLLQLPFFMLGLSCPVI